VNLTKFLTHLIRILGLIFIIITKCVVLPFTFVLFVHNQCSQIKRHSLFIFNMPFSSFVFFSFVYVGVNFVFVGYALLACRVCMYNHIFCSRWRYTL
jgi:hypothetical protein